ncbi:MAG: ABC transporter permease, partial [Candidatus Caldarchaeum sp.]
MSLSPLLMKELRELLSEKTILIGVVLMPLVIFPLLGLAMGPVGESDGGAVSTTSVIVVDQDGGRYASLFLEALKKTGLNPEIVQNVGDDVSELLKNSRALAVVIIPDGFSSQLERKNRPMVSLVLKLGSSSVTEFGKVGDVRDKVLAAASLVGEALASEEGVAVSFYRQPISLSSEV